ncbi:uncharacterized protein LOC121390626 [Gigantopelta aegis]|uniref:uncharacterized protein LOC121390626 n=1 Tax=Gigantopelta aegis TaxID=1735272 RepID=UPI001B88A6D0|nr:uncharacterized protein LOC121390626 [Gigantopelta aegis]
MDFLRNQNINVLPWPSRSLDLNLIEHLWDDLDRRVRQRDNHHLKRFSNFRMYCKTNGQEYHRIVPGWQPSQEDSEITYHVQYRWIKKVRSWEDLHQKLDAIGRRRHFGGLLKRVRRLPTIKEESKLSR